MNRWFEVMTYVCIAGLCVTCHCDHGSIRDGTLARFGKTLAVCGVLATAVSVSGESCAGRDPGISVHRARASSKKAVHQTPRACCLALNVAPWGGHCPRFTVCGDSHGDKVRSRPIVVAMWRVTLTDVPRWILPDLLWRELSVTLRRHGWHCPFSDAAGQI